MSRLGGGSSGFSLAILSISSNFLLSTSACVLWLCTDFRNASSRRPASPRCRWTALSRSANVGGLTCSTCRITALVSGSMCSSASQHGHVTLISGVFFAMLPVYTDLTTGERAQNAQGIQDLHYARQCPRSRHRRDHRRRL